MAIETLGDALDRGWTLRLHCREGKGAVMRKHRAGVAALDADLETLRGPGAGRSRSPGSTAA